MFVNSLGSHNSIAANLSGELRALVASITSQYGLSDVAIISKNGKSFLEIGGQLVEVIIVNGKIIPADTFDGLNSQPEAFFEESGFEPFDSNVLSAAPISQAGLEEVIIVNGEIIPADTFDSLNSQPGAFFEESSFEPFGSKLLSTAPINQAGLAQDLALFSFASIGMLANHSLRSGDTQNSSAQQPVAQNPAQPPANQPNQGPIAIDFTTAAGREYTLITQPMTFADARAYADQVGSRLVSFSDPSDYNAFYNKLDEVVNNNGIAPTIAPDGGRGEYVWLGATDERVEGTWDWENGQSLSTNAPQWGSVEPDDFFNQDGLALSMNGWPFGAPGEWNDVDLENELLFVIEKLPFAEFLFISDGLGNLLDTDTSSTAGVVGSGNSMVTVTLGLNDVETSDEVELYVDGTLIYSDDANKTTGPFSTINLDLEAEDVSTGADTSTIDSRDDVVTLEVKVKRQGLYVQDGAEITWDYQY